MISPFCSKLPQLQPPFNTTKKNSLSGNCTFCQGQITSSDVEDWLAQTSASVWPMHNPLLSLLLLVLSYYELLCHPKLCFSWSQLDHSQPKQQKKNKIDQPQLQLQLHFFYTVYRGSTNNCFETYSRVLIVESWRNVACVAGGICGRVLL